MRRKIKKIIKYIEDNFNKGDILKQSIRKFNVTRYYFTREFKNITGIKFNTFLNNIRINKAKKLLKKEELFVKEICYMVGYNNFDHFRKTFKKYTKACPTNFRKKEK